MTVQKTVYALNTAGAFFTVADVPIGIESPVNKAPLAVLGFIYFKCRKSTLATL